MNINNRVTGGINRQFFEGNNGTWVSDWQIDPRNPNFETKIVRRADGTFMLMGRAVGRDTETPHWTQEFDSSGNTDISQNMHNKPDNF